MIKFDIRYYDSVGSTMDIARDEAMNGAAEGLVIQAGEQVTGRGRRGNQWASPKGNLYQSILLRPKASREQWGQLSFVVAVALAIGTLKCECPQGTVIELKWPNDVMVNGQKLAGILIEAGDDYVIVGTGVNIAHAPEDRAKIQDLFDYSVNDFRDVFLSTLNTYYDQWQTEGFKPIQSLWLERAYRLGEPIQARLPNMIYEGVFEDIDSDGNLLLREESGSLRKINSGEIIMDLTRSRNKD